MDEEHGQITPDLVRLYRADCRGSGGKLTIPCVEGTLLIQGPFPTFTYHLDGVEIDERGVLALHQLDYYP